MDADSGGEWGELYWDYNLPLQMWGGREEGWRVLNYMPRKERCISLDERVTEEQLPEFCSNAAKVLRNLAELFEALGERKIDMIYYPNEPLHEAISDAAKERAGD